MDQPFFTRDNLFLTPQKIAEDFGGAPLEAYIASKNDPFNGFVDKPGADTAPTGLDLATPLIARTASSQHGTYTDSGYKTASAGPCHSVHDASIYGDTLSHSMLEDYGLAFNTTGTWPGYIGPGAASSLFGVDIVSSRNTISNRSDDGASGNSGGGDRHESNDPKPKKCTETGCFARFKTNAELKKHLDRHNRPHKCDVANCTHSKGFGTRNELERHKRSRHAGELPAASGYYRCPECKNDKKWPRSDNFRSHLKAVHKRDKEDINKYMVSAQNIDTQSLLYMSGGGPSFDQPRYDTNVAADGLWAGSLAFLDDTGMSPDLSRPSPLPAPPPNQSATGVQTPNSRLGHYTQAMDLDFLETDQGASDWEQRVAYSQAIVSLPPAKEPDELVTGGTPLPYKALPQRAQDPLFPGPPTYANGGSEPATSDSTTKANTLADDPQLMPTSEVGGVDDDAMDFGPLDEHDSYSEGQQMQDKNPDKGEFAQDKTKDSQQTHGEDSGDTKEKENTNQADSNRTSGSANTTTTATDSTEESLKSVKTKLSTVVSSSDRSVLDFNCMTEDQIKSLFDEAVCNDKFKKLLQEYCSESSARPQPTRVAEPAITPTKEVKSDLPEKACKEDKGGDYKCDSCEKSFKANALLTKHRKRHARPYGCTFINCTKAFGSKDDWKRHERNQHFKLETWKCQEKVVAWSDEAGGETRGEHKPCEQLFYVCEEFTSHLKESHNIAESEKLEERAKCCKSGRKYDRSRGFWCGFCKETLATPEGYGGGKGVSQATQGGQGKAGKKGKQGKQGDKNPGSGTMTKGEEIRQDFDSFIGWRSDHIVNHFFGHECKKVSDWVEAGASACDGNHADLAAVSKSSCSKKRSHDPAAEGGRGGRPPPKKRKAPFIWFCCVCKEYQSLTMDHCSSGCSHIRCSGCEVE